MRIVGAYHHLTVTTQPSCSRVGTMCDVVAEMRDQYENKCASDDATVATLSVEPSSPVGTVITGPMSATASSGTFTFSAVSFNQPGDVMLTITTTVPDTKSVNTNYFSLAGGFFRSYSCGHMCLHHHARWMFSCSGASCIQSVERRLRSWHDVFANCWRHTCMHHHKQFRPCVHVDWM
jgi:hypothetical protein